MPLSTIGANQIAAGAIDTTQLASNAVTNAKLASGAVTAGDLPTGSVLQVVHIKSLTQYNSTASSGTLDPINGTITPKKAGSTFLISCNIPVNTSDDSDAHGGNVNAYYYGFFQRKVNSGSYADADNLGSTSQGGNNCHIELTPNRTGNNSTDYWTGERYRMAHKQTQFLDTPTYNLGDVLTYRMRIQIMTGSYIQIGEPHGYGTDDSYPCQPWGFVVTEIAG